eukprot:31346-Pelagococcus_subviridis.AAC.14
MPTSAAAAVSSRLVVDVAVFTHRAAERLDARAFRGGRARELLLSAGMGEGDAPRQRRASTSFFRVTSASGDR